MTYSINDLTVPEVIASHTWVDKTEFSLPNYAFWQAITNICTSFNSSFLHDENTYRAHTGVSKDTPLIFLKWFDEIRFRRFRDRVADLYNFQQKDDNVATAYIQLTIDIFMDDLTTIQKLSLLYALYSRYYGRLNGFRPVYKAGEMIGFSRCNSVGLTIEDINEKLGTAEFIKDHSELSGLFSTYKTMSPIIQKKHPEVIEATDIVLRQLLNCNDIQTGFQAISDYLKIVTPHRAERKNDSIAMVYKLDCDCHLNDPNIAIAMIKHCLLELYSISI